MSPTHDRIIAFLRSQGARGATDNEMSGELGIPLNTLRPRRVELVRKGLIRPGLTPGGLGSWPTRWVVLKEPKRPPRKPMSLKKAIAPFLAKAMQRVTDYPDATNTSVVVLTISMRDCRALVKAMEP